MGECRRRKDRCPRRPLEERMRPSVPTQPPSQNHANRPPKEARIEPRRSCRCTPDRVLAVNRADGTAEQLIGRLHAGRECLGDDADERDRRTGHVAKRHPATACIPAIEALRRKAHPDDPLLAVSERESRRCNLDNVRAAMSIEEVRAAQVVEEGLAVVAVANDAIYGARGDVSGQAANLSTATLNGHALRHSLLPSCTACRSGQRHQRCDETTAEITKLRPLYPRFLPDLLPSSTTGKESKPGDELLLVN